MAAGNDDDPLIENACVPVLYCDDIAQVEIIDGNLRWLGVRRRRCGMSDRMVREAVFVVIQPAGKLQAMRRKVDRALERAARRLLAEDKLIN